MPALRTGNPIGLPRQILAKLNHYLARLSLVKNGVVVYEKELRWQAGGGRHSLDK
jgi:hypothetical protein